MSTPKASTETHATTHTRTHTHTHTKKTTPKMRMHTCRLRTHARAHNTYATQCKDKNNQTKKQKNEKTIASRLSRAEVDFEIFNTNAHTNKYAQYTRHTVTHTNKRKTKTKKLTKTNKNKTKK